MAHNPTGSSSTEELVRMGLLDTRSHELPLRGEDKVGNTGWLSCLRWIPAWKRAPETEEPGATKGAGLHCPAFRWRCYGPATTSLRRRLMTDAGATLSTGVEVSTVAGDTLPELSTAKME